MIRQTIYLEHWDWLCRVFYEATPFDCDEICNALSTIGIDEDTYRDAKISILQGNFNTGLTYSNLRLGASVMVISKTTSADEFQNSFDHEKGHLAMHIAKAYDIPPFGEEFEYLTGAIGKQLFRIAKHLLCQHCRDKSGI